MLNICGKHVHRQKNQTTNLTRIRLVSTLKHTIHNSQSEITPEIVTKICQRHAFIYAHRKYLCVLGRSFIILFSRFRHFGESQPNYSPMIVFEALSMHYFFQSNDDHNEDDDKIKKNTKKTHRHTS